MFRTIVKIGPVAIHSYGLMIALAFLAGILYIYHRSRAEKLPFDRMLTVAYLLVIAGVVGGRLSYVAIHWDYFAGDLLSVINPFHEDYFGIAGLNLYGGIVLAVVCALVYIAWRRLPLLAIFDLFAPTLGLGLGIGRIGCFLNGCCFGLPTDLPWGVAYPEGSIPHAYFGSAHLHPTQLYTAFYGWILFFVLHRILKNKRFDGQVMAVLFMLESVFRYLIEYVRYYEEEMSFTFWGMHPTYNQITAIALFIFGLVLYFAAPRRLFREPKDHGSAADKS